MRPAGCNVEYIRPAGSKVEYTRPAACKVEYGVGLVKLMRVCVILFPTPPLLT